MRLSDDLCPKCRRSTRSNDRALPRLKRFSSEWSSHLWGLRASNAGLRASNAGFGLLCQYRKNWKLMALWPTVRLVSTILLLLMAATEICACQLISPDSCVFSSHQTTNDFDEGGSGDGCLCCCAHIVIVAPIRPLASVGFISRAVPFEVIQTPDVPASSIEHPPRF
jgi:hypothetical protein